MSKTPPTLLVVAKSPVPGEAKTRLAASTGHTVAARIAAAALIDTVETAASLEWPVVIAATGRLSRATRGDEILAAVSEHRVVPQRGSDFAARLAAAHHDADLGHGVVQVGMDTPHARAQDFAAVADALDSHDAVLGPAEDGGWWVLGVRHAGTAARLAQVPMSRPDTGARTGEALAADGSTLTYVRRLTDVDTWDDALAVAALAPNTRMAAEVRAARDRVPTAAGRDPEMAR